MIRAAICEGATTEDHLAEMCGAGTHCGGCVPLLSEMLEEETRASSSNRSSRSNHSGLHRVRLPVVPASTEC